MHGINEWNLCILHRFKALIIQRASFVYWCICRTMYIIPSSRCWLFVENSNPFHPTYTRKLINGPQKEHLLMVCIQCQRALLVYESSLLHSGASYFIQVLYHDYLSVFLMIDWNVLDFIPKEVNSMWPDNYFFWEFPVQLLVQLKIPLPQHTRPHLCQNCPTRIGPFIYTNHMNQWKFQRQK
mgnify:CR=1 FL=1